MWVKLNKTPEGELAKLAQSALHMPLLDPEVVPHLCHAEEEDDLAPRDLDDILGFKVHECAVYITHDGLPMGIVVVSPGLYMLAS
jgi:hypothetical protein